MHKTSQKKIEKSLIANLRSLISRTAVVCAMKRKADEEEDRGRWRCSATNVGKCLARRSSEELHKSQRQEQSAGSLLGRKEREAKWEAKRMRSLQSPQSLGRFSANVSETSPHGCEGAPWGQGAPCHLAELRSREPLAHR